MLLKKLKARRKRKEKEKQAQANLELAKQMREVGKYLMRQGKE